MHVLGIPVYVCVCVGVHVCVWWRLGVGSVSVCVWWWLGVGSVSVCVCVWVCVCVCLCVCSFGIS